MPALLHHPSLVQHHHPVRFLGRAQAMGHHERRAPADRALAASCRISHSFPASTDASTSSSTRYGGSPTSARARATRWRCPPESVSPRSPTTVSQPRGSSCTSSPSPAVSAAARIRSSSAVLVSQPHVVAQRAREEEGLLRHVADRRAATPRAGGRGRRRRRASTAPRGGSKRRHEESAQRRFAAARRADHGHHATLRAPGSSRRESAASRPS